ncbi:MAG: glycosyltransferase family 4 protein [Woeseia sp.]|nr:glycosyltransferase family 4 protein [Woeseia sp.]NNE61967.1 glycosyltransferase family 4 protein [Woeseia sp.]
MKILFLSDNFPPEVNAPASRTFEHAKRWVQNGHQVTVITCAPNFPEGRVFPGYRNAWRTTETMEGIRVVRVKTYIAGNDGFARRIVDYLSFMISAVVFGIFEKRADVIVGTSPQFFTAAGAWVLSVLRWRPFVFELRDLWPASIVTVGAMETGRAIRFLEKLELFLYRRAAAIVSVTNSFKDELTGRGIDPQKIYVVRNGVDLTRFAPRPPSGELVKSLGIEGKFVLAYLGTHGMAHALDNVLRAAKLLVDAEDIVFLLAGSGAQKESLKKMAAEMQLNNVIFQDSVAKEKMPELWSVCDVALVHLKNDAVFADVIPSKIFESFGMGKPIMIVQPKGEAVDLVEGAHAGTWVPPEDPEALAEEIRKWQADPAMVKRLAAGATEAASRHSRDSLAEDMEKILAKVAEQ